MSAPWNDAISLRELFRILRLRKGIIFLILALTVLTTIGVTYTLPKWYTSTTGIRVEKPNETVTLFRPTAGGNYDPYFINEQFEIIQSRLIILPVLEEYDMVRRLGEQLGSPLTLDTAYTYFVRKMLKVRSQPGASLIDISVEAQEDPQLAANLANSIASTYAANRIDHATGGQLEAINDLRAALAEQEAAVSRQRDLVEQLRREFQISGMELSNRGPQIEVETLRQLERTLISMRVEAIARKTRWERFRDVPPDERINLINAESVSDNNIQNLLQAYLLAEQNFHALEARLGEAHPDYQQARANVAKIRSQLDNLLNGFLNSLESTYKEAEARVSELEKQIVAAQSAQIEASSSRFRPFEEAADKLRDEEQLLQAFRLRLKQSEIDFQVPKRSIEILNDAVAPSRPSKPDWMINIILALIAGGLIGTGTALAMEFLDSSFRSVEELENKLGLPVYGVIPRQQVVLAGDNTADPHAEPYRVIQTNLELHKPKSDSGFVITFQSAGPGEGKSTLLHNVAVLEAAAGHKVLIIDSDTRRPTQHHFFEKERGKGLLDFMARQTTVDTLAQPTTIENLSLITAGQNHDGSSPHISPRDLTALLEHYRGKYDRIFFDSPPVIGISDSSLLASHADGVVFVVQHKRNPQSMTQRAVGIIRHAGGNLLGTVLNQVSTSGQEDYNYYTGNYAYYQKDKPTRPPRKKTTKPTNDNDLFPLEDNISRKR